MTPKYLLIKGNCPFKMMNWAERFVFLYATYDGNHFTFPFINEMRAINENGKTSLQINYSLKETHPEIFEHAIFIGTTLDCEVISMI